MIALSPRDLARAVWPGLVRKHQGMAIVAMASLVNDFVACEGYRPLMQYNTGSLSLANATALWLITHEHAPKTIFEIGTFIGKSLSTMLSAAPGVEVWTVDSSNDFPPDLASPNIHPHPHKKSSTVLTGMETPIDLFFLDGRLQPTDIDHMARLTSPKSIIVLDDFEGTEKGVANVFRLFDESSPFRNWVLVPPPSAEDLGPLADLGQSSLAVLIPPGYIEFARPGNVL